MTTEPSPGEVTLDPAAEAPIDAPLAAELPDATPATPSSADTPDAKPEAPKSLRDVVQNVIKPVVKAPDAPSAPAAEAQDALKPEADAPDPNAPDAQVPFHNHPRWKEMLAERDSLRPQAENYRKITEFMEVTNLTAPEVAEGFEVMAQLKSGDPAELTKARDWFASRLDVLNQRIGATLPADLQAKVDDGLVDAEVAQELARVRANEAYLRNRSDEQDRRSDEQRQADQVATLRTDMVNAVQAWEDTTKAKDPDYASKAKLIETQSLAIAKRHGDPTSAAEALELVKRAYSEVNAMLKDIAPRPRVVTPAPPGMSARVATAPTNLREAIRAAVQK